MDASHDSPSRSIRIRPRVSEADRKRTAKACLRCRNRKSRCVIEKRSEDSSGACRRCLQDGARCLFASDNETVSPSSSYRQPHTNDKRASLASLYDPNRISTPSHEAEILVDGESEDVQVANGPEPTGSARFVVRNPHQTHFIGEVSNSTFVHQVQDAVVSQSPGDAPRDIHSEYSDTIDSNDIDPVILQAVYQGFPPRGVANFLVEVFFHIVEANYYYLDREEFKGRLHAWYDDPNRTDTDSSFLCLVLVIFAMASQFAELKDPRGSRAALCVSENGPGMVFYRKAKLLLSDVVTKCSLESIQACFLLGLFLLPTNISDLSYVYHGMALKMAISGGLHRNIAHSNLEPRVVEVRNRLWWSLYTSERRLTIILDRPESIRETDIDAPMPQPTSALDNAPEEDNLGNLIASIGLTRIFNEVVHLGKTEGFDSESSQERVSKIRGDLAHWLSNLPLHLQRDNLSPEIKSFRGAVHLHLNHHQITVYMGRRSLLKHVHRHLHARRRQDTNDIGPSPASSTVSRAASDSSTVLMRRCVEAAYRVIELIKYLSDNDRLARFSFTDLNCCSSAAIIIMTHEIIQHHPMYEAAMGTALHAMAFMASGCQNAKRGFKLIQHLQGVIANLKSGDAGQGNMDSNGNRSAEYDEWRQWMGISEGDTSTSNADQTPHVASDQFNQALSMDPPLAAGFSDVPSDFNFAIWPDNLDALGLSGFEGFEFPTGRNHMV